MAVGTEDLKKYQDLQKEFIAGISEYPKGSAATDISGRGIIICAGGNRYFTGAYVCASMLRKGGCTLPIEFWYLGMCEVDDAMKKLVEPLGVTCIDALELFKTYPTRRIGGWELKPYAMIHSKFQEMLFLDADNVPVVNPEFLFTTPQYMETGAVFWPDFGRLGPKREIWQICGIPYNDEPEFESGQIVVDKKRCWRELQLTMHLNEHSDFYYKYVHGDKETFHMAWKMLGTRYAMPTRPIQALRATMCQHDFEGKRIFQHRNMAKWNLTGDNTKIQGFLYEEDCLGFLAQLRSLWSGVVQMPEPKTEEGAALRREIIAAAIFDYVRVGHDRRVLELKEDGAIGRGNGGMERSWFIKDWDTDVPQLCIVGNSLTCALKKNEAGIWKGNWTSHEQMPIEVIAHDLQDAQKKAGHKHDSTVAGRRFVYHRVGHDKRVIELAAGGTIGFGKKDLEQVWGFVDVGGQPVLRIGPNMDHPICELTLQGGIWKGRWTQFEKMPIELLAAENEPAPAATPESPKAAAEPAPLPEKKPAQLGGLTTPIPEREQAKANALPFGSDVVKMRWEMELKKIENNFKYHAPSGDQPQRYEKLRAKAKELAILILESCPEGRERAVAMTELETAVMWANAAIARSNQ